MLNMKIQIKHWLTGSVLFEGDFGGLLECLKAAFKADANLRGADLRGASLCNTDLRGANLCDANLCYALLCDANLCYALLCDADLRGANLCNADLRGANLCNADLRNADLCNADLRGASLCNTDLRGANLREMSFVPKIENLDGKILDAIGKEGCSLNMRDWHTCETTHCRAGWAIHLAGESGRVMEGLLGSSTAGALLYARAYPEMKIPDFTASNEDALADIKARAALADKTLTK